MDTRNHTETNKEDIATALLTELDQHDLSSLTEDEQLQQRQSIAANLIDKTKKLAHHVALNILFQATRHPLFADEASHEIIVTGIRQENYHRSALGTQAKTVAFIKDYQTHYPEEVEDLLTNPDRLIIWLNQASSLETSKLFECYFPRGTEYYTKMRTLAETEYANGAPGKGFICFTLMCPSALHESGAQNLSLALQALQASEPDEYPRIAKSAGIRIKPSLENIRIANDCFISLNKIHLEHADLARLKMGGAQLNNTKLNFSTMESCHLHGAQLEKSSLISVNLSNASLAHANFRHAILCDSLLIKADLSNADLCYADLSRTNLWKANLKHTVMIGTKLTDTIFFDPSNFSDTATLNAELDNIHPMLDQHPSYNTLISAVLNDLIKHIQTGSSPDNLIIAMLEAAYEHPTFSQHHENHYLKVASNTITSTLFNWFAKPNEKAMPLVYETTSQQRIRYEINNYKRQQHKEKRPPPPVSAPQPPSMNH